MKVIILSFFFLFNAAPIWLTDFNAAKTQAAKNHKQILLNFSGSDWCGPCIRLHREIFDSETFNKYSANQLILVNADFPRLKKNQLPKAQQQQNGLLAEKYNPAGRFPFTVLIDENGKVVHEWDGFPKGGTNQFMKELSAYNHVSH